MEQHFKTEETISLLAQGGWKLMHITTTIKPRGISEIRKEFSLKTESSKFNRLYKGCLRMLKKRKKQSKTKPQKTPTTQETQNNVLLWPLLTSSTGKLSRHIICAKRETRTSRRVCAGGAWKASPKQVYTYRICGKLFSCITIIQFSVK